MTFNPHSTSFKGEKLLGCSRGSMTPSQHICMLLNAKTRRIESVTVRSIVAALFVSVCAHLGYATPRGVHSVLSCALKSHISIWKFSPMPVEYSSRNRYPDSQVSPPGGLMGETVPCMNLRPRPRRSRTCNCLASTLLG